ncbi:MAG: M23 family peptidase, partial [Methylocella sp.]
MTMGAQVRSQHFGVYLQPAQLRANIEFGVDSAIDADGARHASFERRRVSLRWLSGTLLTGLSGAALIGSAIYAA